MVMYSVIHLVLGAIVRMLMEDKGMVWFKRLTFMVLVATSCSVIANTNFGSAGHGHSGVILADTSMQVSPYVYAISRESSRQDDPAAWQESPDGLSLSCKVGCEVNPGGRQVSLQGSQELLIETTPDADGQVATLKYICTEGRWMAPSGTPIYQCGN